MGARRFTTGVCVSLHMSLPHAVTCPGVVPEALATRVLFRFLSAQSYVMAATTEAELKPCNLLASFQLLPQMAQTSRQVDILRRRTTKKT